MLSMLDCLEYLYLKYKIVLYVFGLFFFFDL